MTKKEEALRQKRGTSEGDDAGIAVTPIGNHPILQETGRFETRKGK
jgi:hypothetical protein